MEYAGVQAFLGRQMPYTGHKRLPQRPIIGPFGKDFVNGVVYLSPAAKYPRITRRPSQGQKGLDERAIMAS